MKELKTAFILIGIMMLISIDYSQERPNSQVNNPAVFKNVMLDTG